MIVEVFLAHAIFFTIMLSYLLCGCKNHPFRLFASQRSICMWSMWTRWTWHI